MSNIKRKMITAVQTQLPSPGRNLFTNTANCGLVGLPCTLKRGMINRNEHGGAGADVGGSLGAWLPLKLPWDAHIAVAQAPQGHRCPELTASAGLSGLWCAASCDCTQ